MPHMSDLAPASTDTADNPRSWPSVNALAAPLVAQLIAEAAALRVGVERLRDGCTIVDAGIDATGGIEAGRLIAKICLGGLGHVRLQASSAFTRWPWQISVNSANPVLACLGSQYAGWSLSHGQGQNAFRALGSGPARALAGTEELFGELHYRDSAETACLVLEVDKRPPAEIIEKVLRACKVAPDRLTFILTPTRSLAGTVQIVSRVLEVALHKAHALGFPVDHVVDGMGCAPLPPPAADFLTAMGRTNDAILYGSHVQLFVSGSEDAARGLADQLSCTNSRDYGQTFADIFKSYRFDFYQIDPQLFAPAEVMVTALESGRTFRGGQVNEQLLDKSFGSE
jgi:methenyltetrahydromethanopterin cyclohydrolase